MNSEEEKTTIQEEQSSNNYSRIETTDINDVLEIMEINKSESKILVLSKK